MLGTELSLLLKKNNIPFTGTDRELDITDLTALKAFVENTSAFDCIINCAAYTAVDKAEDDVETCRKLNTLGPANIALCAKKSGSRFIHISTDYVFNGLGTRPYREDDPTNPTGVYGLTKKDGETAALENNPFTYIIRTAWLYGKYGNNFVQTMLRLMNERDEIKVVNDQRGTPTWAYDLACVIVEFIKTEINIPYGIYHYTNEGETTWFDFAGEIYRLGRESGLIAKDCAVRPCTSAEYPARVKRPAYSVLDKAKITTAAGITIPAWEKSLQEYLKGDS